MCRHTTRNITFIFVEIPKDKVLQRIYAIYKRRIFITQGQGQIKYNVVRGRRRYWIVRTEGSKLTVTRHRQLDLLDIYTPGAVRYLFLFLLFVCSAGTEVLQLRSAIATVSSPYSYVCVSLPPHLHCFYAFQETETKCPMLMRFSVRQYSAD